MVSLTTLYLSPQLSYRPSLLSMAWTSFIMAAKSVLLFSCHIVIINILILIFLEQFCPRGKGAMRLSLYEAPTQGQHTLGVVTARVRYVPSGSSTSHRINCEELWDGTSGLSSLSEKTRKSNHGQMQRKQWHLGYLKTPSVGPAGAWTHDLPHGSPALYQLSQPVGGRSPSLALFDLCDRISSAFDRREHTIGVFLDLSKAFDTVLWQTRALWDPWSSIRMGKKLFLWEGTICRI